MSESCDMCGGPLDLSDGRSWRKRFCGKKCGGDFSNAVQRSRRTLTELHCQECAKPFLHHRLSTRYCSVQCRTWHAQGGRIQELTCGGCGKTWTRERTKGVPTRCSDCRVPPRVSNLFRRFGQAVLARDGWTCGLCHMPIDPACRMPSPGTRTLDHIVPVALGGTHSLDNLRPAHFICNNRRNTDAELPAHKFPTPDLIAA